MLPDPDGGLTACRVAASSVMDPALAARFPGMRTFVRMSADRNRTLRTVSGRRRS
jgi:hypothetical protein